MGLDDGPFTVNSEPPFRGFNDQSLLFQISQKVREAFGGKGRHEMRCRVDVLLVENHSQLVPAR